jgi:hypothetical protein
VPSNEPCSNRTRPPASHCPGKSEGRLCFVCVVAYHVLSVISLPNGFD